MLCTHLASALQAWVLGWGRGRDRLLSGVLEDTPWTPVRFLTGPAQASCTTGGGWRRRARHTSVLGWMHTMCDLVHRPCANVTSHPDSALTPCLLRRVQGPTWRFYVGSPRSPNWVAPQLPCLGAHQACRSPSVWAARGFFMLKLRFCIFGRDPESESVPSQCGPPRGRCTQHRRWEL